MDYVLRYDNRKKSDWQREWRRHVIFLPVYVKGVGVVVDINIVIEQLYMIKNEIDKLGRKKERLN